MLHLNMQGLQDRAAWTQAGIRLPHYDVAAIRARTWKAPVWLHFGAGSILRRLLAAAQQTLLNTGRVDTGILTTESFDSQIIDQVYSPYDVLSLLACTRADGNEKREMIASVASGFKADCAGPDWVRLTRVFCSPTLQMASFTITEKGYAPTGLEKESLPVVEQDLVTRPERPRHATSIAATLLYRRFQAGGTPITIVSMDNCACDGEKLRTGVPSMAQDWVERGLVEPTFPNWLEDEDRVSFPWPVIDKITPHSSERVQEELGRLDVTDIAIARTSTSTLIAPFVNTEIMEYLVLEDALPNEHPALEEVGVYLAGRTTVEETERMKVDTCLNPLHTALAVYSCLLGYTSIVAEMGDVDLEALVEHITAESLPVVEDPGALSPRTFVDEVLYGRFSNPAIPDTPRRIVADTSQKLSVRYGGTLRHYTRQSEQALAGLEFTPLVFVGWCRYLLGVDDRGNIMPASPDPMLPQFQTHLKGTEMGRPGSLARQLRPILSNVALFGVDLYAAGLGERTEEMFRDMLAGPGAMRATLHRNCVYKQP